MVGPQENALGIGRRSERLLAVARHVYYDRAGLSVRRDVERLGDSLGNLVGGMDEKVVLGNGTRKTCRVGFLERVGAYLVKRNLTADKHHRNAVHVRGTKPGNCVREPGTARNDNHCGPAACAGVAVGHVDAALFVAAKDELERRTRKLVEDVDDVASRISEDKLRPDPFKGLYKRTRAGSLLRLQISRSGRIPRRGPSSPWRSS